MDQKTILENQLACYMQLKSPKNTADQNAFLDGEIAKVNQQLQLIASGVIPNKTVKIKKPRVAYDVGVGASHHRHTYK